MLLHIGIQDARPDPLMGNDGHLEEGVSRPVIAVGFGIDDKAQLPMPGDFRLQLHGIGRLMGAVDHHDAIRGRDKPEVTAFNLRVNENVAGELLHEDTSPSVVWPV
jgi:hypothetical protein